eukprot:scaffold2315_cov313-Ochromonas_danica.AAC.1
MELHSSAVGITPLHSTTMTTSSPPPVIPAEAVQPTVNENDKAGSGNGGDVEGEDEDGHLYDTPSTTMSKDDLDNHSHHSHHSLPSPNRLPVKDFTMELQHRSAVELLNEKTQKYQSIL